MEALRKSWQLVPFVTAATCELVVWQAPTRIVNGFVRPRPVAALVLHRGHLVHTKIGVALSITLRFFRNGGMLGSPFASG